jgi:hypothetical protein
MNDAMNSTEISGTPRINSTYTMQIVRSAGRCERRPSATRTASGNAAAMPIVESSSVSGNPPQRSVSTSDKPNTPPRISTKNAANTTIHAISNHRLHNGRVQLATSIASISPVAANGRHCSSNGKRPNRINRYFSAITPQHAPAPSSARHAATSGRATAFTTAQSMNPGT